MTVRANCGSQGRFPVLPAFGVWTPQAASRRFRLTYTVQAFHLCAFADQHDQCLCPAPSLLFWALCIALAGLPASKLLAPGRPAECFCPFDLACFRALLALVGLPECPTVLRLVPITPNRSSLLSSATQKPRLTSASQSMPGRSCFAENFWN